MNKMFLRLLTISLFILFLAACGVEEKAELELSGDSSIVVTINGRAITREEMHRELLNLIMTIGSDMPKEELIKRRSEFELQAIQNLINTELLVTDAKTRGIHIPEMDITNQINMLQKAYANIEFFQKELNIRDLTPQELESEAERALLVEAVINQVLNAVLPPEPEAVSEYYASNKDKLYVPERVHASHILILVEKDESLKVREDKWNELERFRQEALDGKPFEELARAHSQGPSASRGGDLGWFSRDRMDPKISNIAFNLKPGEISEIVETSFGFHIVKLHERMERHTPTLEEIRSDLIKHLHDHSKKMAIQNYIQTIRTSADIQITPLEEK